MELTDAMEKSPATPGIDAGIFRLVAQCLNYYATPGPTRLPLPLRNGKLIIRPTL